MAMEMEIMEMAMVMRQIASIRPQHRTAQMAVHEPHLAATTQNVDMKRSTNA